MNKQERHNQLCQLLNETYVKKNLDYGDSFHLSFLEEGMAMPRIRLSDKLNRFKTLSKDCKQHVLDESITDTLLDLANYALMTILELEEQEQQNSKGNGYIAIPPADARDWPGYTGTDPTACKMGGVYDDRTFF